MGQACKAGKQVEWLAAVDGESYHIIVLLA
jgi:hypothetical protein